MQWGTATAATDTADEAYMDEQILGWVATFSYPAVWVLLVGAGLGLPVSEEWVLLAGGGVAARGGSLVLMIATGWLGVLAGDGLLFRLGRTLGPRAVGSGRLKKVLTPERVAWAQSHFAKGGLKTVFLARFLPGFRAPTFLLAGMSGMRPSRFFAADGLAALVSAPLMVYLGHRFGMAVLQQVRDFGGYLLVVLAVALVGYLGFRRWQRARQRH